MKMQSPELRDALAAEYVLGTLRGLARARFERWLKDDVKLQDDVALWEGLLQGFNESIKPVSAPPRLWTALERRLGFVEQDQKAHSPVVAAGLRWWRGAGISFAIAAMLVAVLVFRPSPELDSFQPDMQIALQNKQARTVWQLQADTHSNTLIATAIRPIQLPDDRSLELWLIPKSGGAPVSLGLMPTGMDNKLVITAEVALGEAAAFAVSLEPTGGSPTGGPTGPVLYVQEVGAT